MQYKQKLYDFGQISDRSINEFLYKLQPKQHQQNQYHNILLERQKQQSLNTTNINGHQQYAKILLRKPKKQSANNMQLCQCCFEELPNRPKWCRICGLYACHQCIVRMRMLPDLEQPVPFCQKCDKQFLEAVLDKEFVEGFMLRNKSLKVLAKQQEMIQQLLKIQKHKIVSQQDQTGVKNELLYASNRILQLKTEYQSQKAELNQTQRKIDWGEQIYKNLKKKYQKLAKITTISFSSSMADYNQKMIPPQADFDDSLIGENLNESVLQSMLNQDENNEVNSTNKCECNIS